MLEFKFNIKTKCCCGHLLFSETCVRGHLISIKLQPALKGRHFVIPSVKLDSKLTYIAQPPTFIGHSYSIS